jgi:hypothetical protein
LMILQQKLDGFCRTWLFQDMAFSYGIVNFDVHFISLFYC